MIDYLAYNKMKRVFMDSDYYEMIRQKALKLMKADSLHTNKVESISTPVKISSYVKRPDTEMKDFISINNQYTDDCLLSKEMYDQLLYLVNKMYEAYNLLLEQMKFSEYNCISFINGKCPKVKCLCYNKSFYQ